MNDDKAPRVPSHPPPAPGAEIASSLGEALEGEFRRFDLLCVRVWQVVTAMGAVGGLIIWRAIPAELGIWVSSGFFAAFAWFTVQHALLRRGYGGHRLTIVSVLVEGLIPFGFLLVTYFGQGPAYAVGSWLVPLLYATLLVAWVARLRPLAPVLLGAVSGVLYIVSYYAFVRAGLAASIADGPLYSPLMAWSRGISMIMGGVLAGLVSRALRGAIAKAEREARQRDLFGKYQIVRPIAAGGMGAVHEAIYCPEGGFKRKVAVKRIHEHLAKEEDFVVAFRREAELSAQLVHKNIVQVMDFGRIDESYFLAMEYIDGLTLSSMLRRLGRVKHPIAEPVVRHVVKQLLSGLHYSHAVARDPEGQLLRIVHRDLSPANILLSKSGDVKISDFGVARALRDATAMDTRTVAGHLGYMAPEQSKGRPLDERCDLFAVGVIAWEMLMGRPLFYRGSEGPTLLAVLNHDVPSVMVQRTELDPAWDDVISRALSVDPDARYGTAAALDAAFDAIPVGRGADAEPSAALVELVGFALTLPAKAPKASGEQDTQDSNVSQELPTKVARKAGD